MSPAEAVLLLGGPVLWAGWAVERPIADLWRRLVRSNQR